MKYNVATGFPLLAALVALAATAVLPAAAQSPNVTQAPGAGDPTDGLTTMEVRLVPVGRAVGAGEVEGRLEARDNGTAAWGGVCLTGFTTAAAARACQSLGL